MLVERGVWVCSVAVGRFVGIFGMYVVFEHANAVAAMRVIVMIVRRILVCLISVVPWTWTVLFLVLVIDRVPQGGGPVGCSEGIW